MSRTRTDHLDISPQDSSRHQDFNHHNSQDFGRRFWRPEAKLQAPIRSVPIKGDFPGILSSKIEQSSAMILRLCDELALKIATKYQDKSFQRISKTPGSEKCNEGGSNVPSTMMSNRKTAWSEADSDGKITASQPQFRENMGVMTPVKGSAHSDSHFLSPRPFTTTSGQAERFSQSIGPHQSLSKSGSFSPRVKNSLSMHLRQTSRGTSRTSNRSPPQNSDERRLRSELTDYSSKIERAVQEMNQYVEIAGMWSSESRLLAPQRPASTPRMLDMVQTGFGNQPIHNRPLSRPNSQADGDNRLHPTLAAQTPPHSGSHANKDLSAVDDCTNDTAQRRHKSPRKKPIQPPLPKRLDYYRMPFLPGPSLFRARFFAIRRAATAAANPAQNPAIPANDFQQSKHDWQRSSQDSEGEAHGSRRRSHDEAADGASGLWESFLHSSGGAGAGSGHEPSHESSTSESDSAADAPATADWMTWKRLGYVTGGGPGSIRSRNGTGQRIRSEFMQVNLSMGAHAGRSLAGGSDGSPRPMRHNPSPRLAGPGGSDPTGPARSHAGQAWVQHSRRPAAAAPAGQLGRANSANPGWQAEAWLTGTDSGPSRRELQVPGSGSAVAVGAAVPRAPSSANAGPIGPGRHPAPPGSADSPRREYHTSSVGAAAARSLKGPVAAKAYGGAAGAHGAGAVVSPADAAAPPPVGQHVPSPPGPRMTPGRQAPAAARSIRMAGTAAKRDSDSPAQPTAAVAAGTRTGKEHLAGDPAVASTGSQRPRAATRVGAAAAAGVDSGVPAQPKLPAPTAGAQGSQHSSGFVGRRFSNSRGRQAEGLADGPSPRRWHVPAGLEADLISRRKAVQAKESKGAITQKAPAAHTVAGSAAACSAKAKAEGAVRGGMHEGQSGVGGADSDLDRLDAPCSRDEQGGSEMPGASGGGAVHESVPVSGGKQEGARDLVETEKDVSGTAAGWMEDADGEDGVVLLGDTWTNSDLGLSPKAENPLKLVDDHSGSAADQGEHETLRVPKAEELELKGEASAIPLALAQPLPDATQPTSLSETEPRAVNEDTATAAVIVSPGALFDQLEQEASESTTSGAHAEGSKSPAASMVGYRDEIDINSAGADQAVGSCGTIVARLTSRADDVASELSNAAALAGGMTDPVLCNPKMIVLEVIRTSAPTDSGEIRVEAEAPPLASLTIQVGDCNSDGVALVLKRTDDIDPVPADEPNILTPVSKPTDDIDPELKILPPVSTPTDDIDSEPADGQDYDMDFEAEPNILPSVSKTTDEIDPEPAVEPNILPSVSKPTDDIDSEPADGQDYDMDFEAEPNILPLVSKPTDDIDSEPADGQDYDMDFEAEPNILPSVSKPTDEIDPEPADEPNALPSELKSTDDIDLELNILPLVSKPTDNIDPEPADELNILPSVSKPTDEIDSEPADRQDYDKDFEAEPNILPSVSKPTNEIDPEPADEPNALPSELKSTDDIDPDLNTLPPVSKPTDEIDSEPADRQDYDRDFEAEPNTLPSVSKPTDEIGPEPADGQDYDINFDAEPTTFPLVSKPTDDIEPELIIFPPVSKRTVEIGPEPVDGQDYEINFDAQPNTLPSVSKRTDEIDSVPADEPNALPSVSKPTDEIDPELSILPSVSKPTDEIDPEPAHSQDYNKDFDAEPTTFPSVSKRTAEIGPESADGQDYDMDFEAVGSMTAEGESKEEDMQEIEKARAPDHREEGESGGGLGSISGSDNMFSNKNLIEADMVTPGAGTLTSADNADSNKAKNLEEAKASIASKHSEAEIEEDGRGRSKTEQATHDSDFEEMAIVELGHINDEVDAVKATEEDHSAQVLQVEEIESESNQAVCQGNAASNIAGNVMLSDGTLPTGDIKDTVVQSRSASDECDRTGQDDRAMEAPSTINSSSPSLVVGSTEEQTQPFLHDADLHTMADKCDERITCEDRSEGSDAFVSPADQQTEFRAETEGADKALDYVSMKLIVEQVMAELVAVVVAITPVRWSRDARRNGIEDGLNTNSSDLSASDRCQNNLFGIAQDERVMEGPSTINSSSPSLVVGSTEEQTQRLLDDADLQTMPDKCDERITCEDRSEGSDAFVSPADQQTEFRAETEGADKALDYVSMKLIVDQVMAELVGAVVVTITPVRLSRDVRRNGIEDDLNMNSSDLSVSERCQNEAQTALMSNVIGGDGDTGSKASASSFDDASPALIDKHMTGFDLAGEAIHQTSVKESIPGNLDGASSHKPERHVQVETTSIDDEIQNIHFVVVQVIGTMVAVVESTVAERNSTYSRLCNFEQSGDDCKCSNDSVASMTLNEEVVTIEETQNPSHTDYQASGIVENTTVLTIESNAGISSKTAEIYVIREAVTEIIAILVSRASEAAGYYLTDRLCKIRDDIPATPGILPKSEAEESYDDNFDADNGNLFGYKKEKAPIESLDIRMRVEHASDSGIVLAIKLQRDTTKSIDSAGDEESDNLLREARNLLQDLGEDYAEAILSAVRDPFSPAAAFVRRSSSSDAAEGIETSLARYPALIPSLASTVDRLETSTFAFSPGLNHDPSEALKISGEPVRNRDWNDVAAKIDGEPLSPDNHRPPEISETLSAEKEASRGEETNQRSKSHQLPSAEGRVQGHDMNARNDLGEQSSDHRGDAQTPPGIVIGPHDTSISAPGRTLTSAPRRPEDRSGGGGGGRDFSPAGSGRTRMSGVSSIVDVSASSATDDLSVCSSLSDTPDGAPIQSPAKDDDGDLFSRRAS